MKKILIISLLLLCIFSGCQKKTEIKSDKTEVIFWHAMGGPLGEALTNLVDRFNDTHQDIYINAINMGNYTALSQKLMASIQAGTQPDIVQVFESWTANLISESDDEIIVSMNHFYEKDPNFTEEDLNDIYSVFIKSNTIDGKLWSLPFNKSVRVLYYNKDLLFQNNLDPNKPPKTWDEFRHFCKLLTKDEDGDGVPEIYGTTITVDSWQFENLLLQAGGEIMNEDYTKPAFNSKEGVMALNYLDGLLNEDNSCYLSTGYEGQNDFLAGKVAMIEGSSVSMAYMKRNGINFNMGIAAIPVNKTKKNIISGTNVTIFKNDNEKVQDGAWEFVKWFTDAPQTAEWSEHTYYMPVRKSAFLEKRLKDRLDGNPEIASVYEQLEYASFEPPIKEWYKTRTHLRDHVIEKVFRGIVDPEEALNNAAEKMIEDLK